MKLFLKGLPFADLVEAATVKNGIKVCSEEEKAKLITYYDHMRDKKSLIKFVPASGEASRMFKFLFDFLNDYQPKEESLPDYISRTDKSEISTFFNHINRFPFFELLPNELKSKFEDRQLCGDLAVEIVRVLLDESRMHLSGLPKGLIPFHKYEAGIISAFHEHLKEAANFASSNGRARLHFTVSKRHEHKFKDELDAIRSRLEKETRIQFEVGFSNQGEMTDTIAVDLDNEPIRDNEGNLVFRASGHGALLQNLNRIEADLVFIKNVDNVVVTEYEGDISEYKKMLGGLLLQLQRDCHDQLQQLTQEDFDVSQLEVIGNFVIDKLNQQLPRGFHALSDQDKRGTLVRLLNRPIRVCGMVKNDGQPGGGPFWVRDKTGQISLQIIEASQVDSANRDQLNILNNASHFNPVDLVCGLKDYKGDKFDLTNFVNSETAFISKKNYLGKDIKALELPGLWNGSMYNWITIFVEVPLKTFNPVKTVNDLLKPRHQVKNLE